MKYTILILFSLAVGACSSPTLEDRAAAGDRDAIRQLAGLYLFGEKGYDRDWARGEELLGRLTMRGDVKAAHQLAMIAFLRSDRAEAIVRFERAARMGHSPSSLMAASLIQMDGCGDGAALKVFDHLETAIRKGNVEGERQLRRLVVGIAEAGRSGMLDERSSGCYLEARRRGYIGPQVPYGSDNREA